MNRLEQFDVYLVPCDDIFYDHEFNCRGEFTLQSVQGLADSIRDDGLLEPIVLQPAADSLTIPDGFRYRLLAGHRRYVAWSKVLRRTEIPARVRPGLSPKQAELVNLLENLERKDLNPLEIAKAIAKRFPHASTREVAAELHTDHMWVWRHLLVLRQPEEIQQMVASGRLKLIHVQDYIAPCKTVSAKLRAAKRLIEASPSEMTRLRQEYRMLARPRSRKEISDKIAYMLEMGLHEVAPIVTRLAAWMARGISDEEIDQDIAKFANRLRK